LRARWGGRVFAPPRSSAAAEAVATDLVAQGPLQLEGLGEERLTLALLPHGEIGQGRSYDRQNWDVCEKTTPTGPDFLRLLLDADRVTYRLRRVAPWHWEGSRLRSPEVEIRASLETARSTLPAFQPERSRGLIDDLLAAAGFPACSPQADA